MRNAISRPLFLLLFIFSLLAPVGLPPADLAQQDTVSAEMASVQGSGNYNTGT